MSEEELKLIKVSEGTDGELYYNMDLRDLEYNVSQKVMLLYDEPMDGEFKSKQSKKMVHWYNYGFAVDGKRVGTFMYDYYKSTKRKTSLINLMAEFEEGDILEITKKEGRVKKGTRKGTSFKMWKVEKTGHDDDFDYDELTSPEDDGITEPDKKRKTTEKKDENQKKLGGLTKKKDDAKEVKEITVKQVAKMLDKAGYDTTDKNVDDVCDNVEPLTKENVEKYLSGQ